MKRGAESQLTRDDAEQEVEDNADDEPKRGFKKAEESALVERKIRGLPRRAAGSAGPSSASIGAATPDSAAPTVPKFSGFAGFGTSTAGSTPFTFGLPAKTPTQSATPLAFPSSSLPALGSNPTPSTAPTTTQTTSTSASNATRLFTSIVNSSAESTSGPTPPETKLSNGHSAEPKEDAVEAETVYYTALRGLNVAFLAACQKAVDADPYTDIASVLERYSQLRSGIKSDYENRPKKTSSTPTATAESKLPPPPPASFAGFGGSSFASTPATLTQSQPKSSFPAPTGGFSGFGFPPATSTTQPGEGFKPQLASSPPPANKSVLNFGDKTAEESSKGAEGGPSTSNGVKTAFAFGSSSSTSSFAFGDTGKKTGDTVFGATPSVFSSSMFGVSAEKKTEESDKPKEPTPAPSSVFVGGLVSDKSASSSPSPFAFGSSSPKPPFAFGKPSGSGSLGNPVGFGFGSPPKTPDAAPGPSSTTSGFSFGAPKVAELNGDSEGSEATKHEAAEDAPPLLVTNSVHDQDGEGEEDEETKFEQKCKVFKMAKKEDGTQEWKDMGVGLLKLKAHKETNVRRLLLRNSSTGKIQINFNVHAGMNPSVAKNVVSLMAHEEGVSLPYKLRVKTAEQAEELKRVLQEEAEKVKS